MTIILIVFLIALVYGGLTGRGVTDSRDPRYSLGLVIHRRPSAHRPNTDAPTPPSADAAEGPSADTIAPMPS
jgi:hypothetical protein